MSALDDAIAAHLAHPAGACSDPLSESLYEQANCTQPAPLAHPLVLNEAWADEPVRVPHNFWLYTLAFLVGLLLGGCGGGDDCVEEEGRATTQPVDCKARPELCK